MDFVLLLLINLAVLAFMYLTLRHQLMKRYSSENFLEQLQKEVNGIMTDLNQTTEMNVQILSAESQKIKNLQQKVEARISEMQQIFTMLDRADGRYNEIISNSTKRKSHAQTAASRTYGESLKNSQYDASDAPLFADPNMRPADIETANSADMHSSQSATPAPNPREQVLGLYNQGRDILEISEITRLPVGEVELIIELSK